MVAALSSEPWRRTPTFPSFPLSHCDSHQEEQNAPGQSEFERIKDNRHDPSSCRGLFLPRGPVEARHLGQSLRSLLVPPSPPVGTVGFCQFVGPSPRPPNSIRLVTGSYPTWTRDNPGFLSQMFTPRGTSGRQFNPPDGSISNRRLMLPSPSLQADSFRLS